MFGIFSKKNEYKKTLERINALEGRYVSYTDEEMRIASTTLRTRGIQEGLHEQLREEAFALVRETAKRVLGQRQYDVQLLAGLALSDGRIAEMGTGEGKTLAATAPAYYYALVGKGVHVITVNDYLAQRDAIWMGQIYHALGMSTACIVHDAAYIYDPEWNTPEGARIDEVRDTMGAFHVEHAFLKPISRHEAYQADIVYGTNHEFGFDYLRDNLAYHTQQQVQRIVTPEGTVGRHYFALIDEVDSILIDEARTPLIISAPDTEAAEYYKLFARIVADLHQEDDYVVDEKNKFVRMTDSGIERVQRVLGIENLYDPQHVRLVHYLEESLKARALFFKDRQYVVQNNEIVIVDEFTGRMMHGRRYSGGLHQALEAKEHVHIQQESKTFAQITIQNYFRLYERIAGMTGTAQTSAEEFNKVYGLDVYVVPPHKPRIRIDHPDLVYQTKEKKYEAIVSKVQEKIVQNQPVLIGTTSIDENELLSGYLARAGVVHEVLNAKNHEREGEIIAQAGRAGAVTLATNMAGRGVDIILGGNPPDTIAMKQVKQAGGLFVLGTQRNDARRVDNQLRGRSGRQGDPGETQFFLSLEDDMMRIFGGERIQRLMTRMNLPLDMPIESSLVVKAINEAQKKVEGLHFDARKHLLEYDTVLHKQRSAVYRRRQSMLEAIERGHTGELLSDMVIHTIQRLYETQYTTHGHETSTQQGIPEYITEQLRAIKIIDDIHTLTQEDIELVQHGTLPMCVQEHITQAIAQQETGIRMLAALDMYWTNHLENLEALLESVRMRAYGQKDPLVEYKRESYELFKDLIVNAENWVVSNVFVMTDAQARAHAQGITHTSAPQQKTTGFSGTGRNDVCPCGSGKKYKKCHGM